VGGGGGGRIVRERNTVTESATRHSRVPCGIDVNERWAGAYMLNTRSEENNTVFSSDLPCFVNICTLNMYVSMSYSGLTRRNTVFIFLWLRHRNT